MKIEYTMLVHNVEDYAPFKGAILGYGTSSLYPNENRLQSKPINSLVEMLVAKGNKGIIIVGNWEGQYNQLLRIISAVSRRGLEVLIAIETTLPEFYEQIGRESAIASKMLEAYEMIMEDIKEDNPLQHLGGVVLDAMNERTYYIRTNDGALHIITVEEENGTETTS